MLLGKGCSTEHLWASEGNWLESGKLRALRQGVLSVVALGKPG